MFDAALKAHEAEIDAIAGNTDAPTIDNTLAALELAGEPLDRVSSIFWCRAGAHTNDAIQALERDISPKMSRHFSAISMNEKLFARIDDLYQRREALKLDAETLRVLEKTWKGFVRSGAKLDADGKKRLADDQRGAVLARHDFRPERARRRAATGRCSSTRPTLPACRIS